MRILLTGSRSFVTTDIARTLYKQGNIIYLADSVDFDYSRHSKYIQDSFRVPSARFDENGYINNIISIVKQNHIDKIIPLGEEVFYLAKHYSEINIECHNTVLHAGTTDQLEQLHNKYRFYELAKKLSISVPFSKTVNSPDEIIDYQSNRHKHIILKPIYSRFGRQQYEIKSVNKTNLKNIDWNTNYLLQNFIKGEPISSYSFSPDDAVITYKSTLQTIKPSAMASANKITTPKEIKDIDSNIRQILGYSGQLGLDFIKTSDGQFYLLEANPRATIGASLTYRNQVQSRLLMFHYLLGKAFSFKKLPRFMWIFITYPDLLFSLTDIKPAINSQLGGLKSYLSFRRDHPGMGTREYASYDMEYNGEPFDYKVTEATTSDSNDILKLLENIPTKGALRMIYTRRPDAYTSFHSDGNTSIGLIKDQQNKIAIMGTSTENRFYINGQEKALGYIGSFRKSPNSPYIANWLEKILEAYKKPGKDLFFCSIISTNKHAIDVFTKKRPYLPPLKLVAKYTIFVVNPKQFKPVKYSQDISFNNLLASEEHLALSFIKTEGQKYDLFPVIDNLQNNFLNIVVKNSYVLKRGAKIVGFACINNQNHKKQFIIKSYSWPLRLFLPLNPFIKAMGLMPLPEINKPIACPAISLCLVENNNKELFNALMEGVAAELKPDYDMFMVALPNNNQNFAALNNWHNFKLENNLYTINFSDKKLYVKQPYTEVSVLL